MSVYLSHPVRRMRDDPQSGETVALIVTQSGDEPAALDALASHLEAAGATIEAELRFGALRVRVAESDVARLCTLDGIDAIETATTRSLDAGDTGEDV